MRYSVTEGGYKVKVTLASLASESSGGFHATDIYVYRSSDMPYRDRGNEI